MHIAAAVVMAGIYMYNLPLAVAIVWRPGKLGIGIGAFDTGGALSRALKQMAEEKKRKKPTIRRAVRLLAELIKRMDLRYFSARLLVGTDDAARTALLCGAVAALTHTLRGAAKAGKVDVRPDFSGEIFEGEVRAAAIIKLGRAVMAYAASR